MAHTTGLEFGADFVRICHIEHSAKGYKILQLRQLEFNQELQEEDKEEKVAKIKELFQGISKGQVYLSLSSENCIFRIIQVPFGEPEQIRKIIKFEAETHIHSCPIEEILIDFQKIDEEERPQVLLVGYYKKDLQLLLEHLKEARIYPLAADLDIHGTINTLINLALIDAEDSCLVFDIGSHSSKILLVDEGKLIQIRVLRFGIYSLQEELSEQKTSWQEDPSFILDNLFLSIPFIEEDQSLVPDEQELLDRIQTEFEKELQFSKVEDLFKKIIKETSRTMATLSFKKNPEKIFMFCEKDIPEAAQYLQDAFEMEVITPNLMKEIPHNLEKEIVAQNIPVHNIFGMAVSARNKSPLKMEFLQEEFRSIDRFEVLKKPLMILLSLLFILFFCSGLLWRSRTQKISVTLEKLNKKAMALLKENAPEQVKRVVVLSEAKRVLSIKNRLNNLLQDLVFQQGTNASSDLLPTFILWKNFFKKLKKVRRQLSVFRIRLLIVNQKEIRLQGWVRQETEIQVVINALKKDPLFKTIELEGSIRKKEGIVPFKIRVVFPKNKKN